MRHPQHQRPTRTWESQSPPPWHASAPQSQADFLWSAIQDLDGQIQETQAEVEEINDRLKSVERTRKAITMTVSFLYRDGGKLLVWIGMLLFAITGITGQLPPIISETASLIRSLNGQN